MDLSNVVLRDISVHYIGNKGTGGEFIKSDAKLELAEREKKILAEAFMSRFVTDKVRPRRFTF